MLREGTVVWEPEFVSRPFAAEQYSWCPKCRVSIRPGEIIGRLKVGIRTLEQGKFVEYFKSHFYAHVDCPERAMGNCHIHGQSVHTEEVECPICGNKLEKTQ
jgi:hypothetical protein